MKQAIAALWANMKRPWPRLMRTGERHGFEIGTDGLVHPLPGTNLFMNGKTIVTEAARWRDPQECLRSVPGVWFPFRDEPSVISGNAPRIYWGTVASLAEQHSGTIVADWEDKDSSFPKVCSDTAAFEVEAVM